MTLDGSSGARAPVAILARRALRLTSHPALAAEDRGRVCWPLKLSGLGKLLVLLL